MNAVVLVEYSDPVISQSMSAVLGAAQQAKELHGYDSLRALVVGGSDAAAAAKAAAGFDVDEVVYCTAPGLENYLAVEHGNVIEQCIEQLGVDVFIAPCSSMGKDLAPRIAAFMDAGQASDVLAFLDSGVFERLMYAGNVVAHVEILTPRKVVTVRASAFAAGSESGSDAPIRELAVQLVPSGLQQYVGLKGSESARPKLGEAGIVVSAGRGIQSVEQFESIVFPLADVLGAAVGASRAAVDAGFAPNDWQVGQTGKVVAPDLYIAIGISGAIQHLAGMKTSKCIVAINNDPEAPIFDIADYGLVDDLFTAVPRLIELLQSRGGED